MRLLIDGDLLIYRAGFAMESEQHRLWHEEDSFELPPVSHHIQALKMTIHSILDKFPDRDSYVIFLTSNDKSNYRFEIAYTKPYKGNRSKKPIFYEVLRNYLLDNYSSRMVSGQEADDALGIEQSTSAKGTTCIVSTDKDLQMIPGYHYNFVKGEMSYVTENEALDTFYRQMLVGDTADNVAGVHGIGPVKAAKILAHCWRGQDNNFDEQEAFDQVLLRYDDPKRFLESGRLLWLRRSENELWKPTETVETLSDRLKQLKEDLRQCQEDNT